MELDLNPVLQGTRAHTQMLYNWDQSVLKLFGVPRADKFPVGSSGHLLVNKQMSSRSAVPGAWTWWDRHTGNSHHTVQEHSSQVHMEAQNRGVLAKKENDSIT